MLSKTTIGQQRALLDRYCDMMQKTNAGVEKIIYCDPTLQQNGSAFALPALQNLNRDLQMLNHLTSDDGGNTGKGRGGVNASFLSEDGKTGGTGMGIGAVSSPVSTVATASA